MPKHQEVDESYSTIAFAKDLLAGVRAGSKKDAGYLHAMDQVTIMAENFKKIRGDYPGQSDSTPVIWNLEVMPTKQKHEVDEMISHLGKYFPHQTHEGNDTDGAHFDPRNGFEEWNYFANYKKVTPESQSLLSAMLGHLVMEKVVGDDSEFMKRDHNKLNLFAQHDLAGEYITPEQRKIALQTMGVDVTEYVQTISSLFGADQGQRLFRKCLVSGQINPRTAMSLYKEIQADLQPTIAHRRRQKR